MAKRTHYTLIDTINGYSASDKDWQDAYKEFLEENELTENDKDIYDFLAEQEEIDCDDLFTNLRYVRVGEVKVTGKLGLWDGQHEIVPRVFNSLLDAVYACLDKIDYFKIEVWKSKIEITACHHDGRNHFVLRPSIKREDMWLY
jgi:hypothetical protein